MIFVTSGGLPSDARIMSPGGSGKVEFVEDYPCEGGGCTEAAPASLFLTYSETGVETGLHPAAEEGTNAAAPEIFPVPEGILRATAGSSSDEYDALGNPLTVDENGLRGPDTNVSGPSEVFAQLDEGVFLAAVSPATTLVVDISTRETLIDPVLHCIA